MLKSIFIGNSDFVLPLLDTLLKKTHLQAIITGQDRVITKRKKSIMLPEPKIFGNDHHIPVFQPIKMKSPEFLYQVKDLKADIFFLCSFNRILPPEFFNIAPLGCFNFHASLLPSYRGASPLHQVLLNGDVTTGITLQKINENIDEGNIFWTERLSIQPLEIFPTLKHRMALLTKNVCNHFLNYVEKNGTLPQELQQEGTPSFCTKIKKENGMINFELDNAYKIFNRYRAFYLWPEIHFTFRTKQFKIKDCSYIKENSHYPPSTIIKIDQDSIWVQTYQGILCIASIHPQNKSSISGKAFMHGYQLKIGDQIK